jgi:hypothetical protein
VLPSDEDASSSTVAPQYPPYQPYGAGQDAQAGYNGAPTQQGGYAASYPAYQPAPVAAPLPARQGRPRAAAPVPGHHPIGRRLPPPSSISPFVRETIALKIRVDAVAGEQILGRQEQVWDRAIDGSAFPSPSRTPRRDPLLACSSGRTAAASHLPPCGSTGRGATNPSARRGVMGRRGEGCRRTRTPPRAAARTTGVSARSPGTVSAPRAPTPRSRFRSLPCSVCLFVSVGAIAVRLAAAAPNADLLAQKN